MRIAEALARLDAAAAAAAARGSLLFHLDLATEVARAAFAAQAIDCALPVPLAGEEGYRVLAFDDAPLRRVVAEATFDAAGDVVVTRDAVAVPPRAATLADARATAVAASPVDDRSAIVVIPANMRDVPLEAYALATGAEPDEVRLAGHRLLTLDPMGRRVLSERELAVASAPVRCRVGALRDLVFASPEATPGEMHTYLSLKHGVPLTVTTAQSGLRWRVDAERVERLSTG